MGSEFCLCGQFESSKSAKIHKESKFKASKYVKMADFALLDLPILVFNEFVHFLRTEIYQINQIQSSKNGKNSSFKSLNSPKLISRKI